MLHHTRASSTPHCLGLYITAVVGDIEETAGPFDGTTMLHCFSLGQVRPGLNRPPIRSRPSGPRNAHPHPPARSPSVRQDSITYDATVLLFMFGAILGAIFLVMAFVLRENR